jgi:hypothetical protein
MPDFNVRSDAVNVEQIMEQIRGRIREKRGVDYTEQQIRELAEVKLEKFLEPRGVRSDLLDQFRKAQPAYEPPELPNFAFEDDTLFESHRGAIRWMRKLLLPFLKLLFNPNPLIQALHIQARLNTMNAEREARRESGRRAMDQLYYELIHNLVLETTRMGIEVKNMKMRLESVSSRLEFNERRARALESAVVYKPAADEQPAPQRPAPQPVQQPRYTSPPPPRQTPPQQRSAPPPAAAPPPVVAEGPTDSSTTSAPTNAQATPGQPAAVADGPGQRSRRRRRRRGRRGGGAAAVVIGDSSTATDPAALTDASDQMESDDRMDDDGSPELEEAPAVAADNVEQALTPEVQRTEPVEPVAAAPLVATTVPEPTHEIAAPATAPAPPEPAASSPTASADGSQGGSDPDSQ